MVTDGGVYKVEANNLASASENKIHDDRVARQFGFTGALVPGVDVYAYACHLIVDRLGPGLARSWSKCVPFSEACLSRLHRAGECDGGRSPAYVQGRKRR
jgi:hypothetical protein